MRVNGTTSESPIGERLSWSTETTTNGRAFACSEPLVGSGSAQTTSPWRGASLNSRAAGRRSPQGLRSRPGTRRDSAGSAASRFQHSSASASSERSSASLTSSSATSSLAGTPRLRASAFSRSRVSDGTRIVVVAFMHSQSTLQHELLVELGRRRFPMCRRLDVQSVASVNEATSGRVFPLIVDRIRRSSAGSVWQTRVADTPD